MSISATLLTACLLMSMLALPVAPRSLGSHISKRSTSSNSNGGTTVHVHKLAATGDVTVKETHTLNNLNYLAVGRMPTHNIARSLLKFQPIPESCKYVAKAELFAYYYEAFFWNPVLYIQNSFYPKNIQVRQLLVDWSEDKATSIYRLASETWNDEGSVLNVTQVSIEPEEESVTIHETQQLGYIKFDVTSIAQKWTAGDEDYGVILSMSDEEKVGRQIHMYSREAEDVNGMDVKPYLKVTCWSDFCAPLAQRRGGQQEIADDQETKTQEAMPEASTDQSNNSKLISSGGSTFTVPANSYKR